MNQQESPFRKIVAGFVIFTFLGLVGALPAGILGLMGGSEVASDIYILAALVLGSWLPLKILIDRVVKGSSEIPIPTKFSFATSFVIGFALIVAVPFLYLMTITAFLAGVLAYLVSQNTLIMGLLAAFAVQTLSIYRSAQREKELGVAGNRHIYTHFQNMNMSANYDISIDAESSRMAEDIYDDEPDVLFLPAERLRDVDSENDDDGITIKIDSQSERDES